METSNRCNLQMFSCIVVLLFWSPRVIPVTAIATAPTLPQQQNQQISPSTFTRNLQQIQNVSSKITETPFNCSNIAANTSATEFTAYVEFLQPSSNTSTDDSWSSIVHQDFLLSVFIDTYHAFQNTTCLPNNDNSDNDEIDDNKRIITSASILLETTTTGEGTSGGDGDQQGNPSEPRMTVVIAEVNVTCRGCSSDGRDDFLFLPNDDLESASFTTDTSSTNGTLSSCVCDPPTIQDFSLIFQEQLRTQNNNASTTNNSSYDNLQISELNMEDIDQDDEENSCQTVPPILTTTNMVLYFDNNNQQSSTILPSSSFLVLEDAVVEIYNLNNIQESTGLCDPLSRQIVSVDASLLVDSDDSTTLLRPSLSDDENDSMYYDVAVLLEVVLTCRGCAEGHGRNILFDAERTQETSTNTTETNMTTTTTSLNQQQNQEDAADCICVGIDNQNNTIIQGGPTAEEFQEILALVLAQEQDDDGFPTDMILVDVEEVSTVSCSSLDDTADQMPTNLTQTILIDFLADCSLLDADSSFFANEFVAIYNSLSEEQYCDPHFRRLSSARVVRRGEQRPEDGGAVTVQLELTGTCIGCDPETDGFYDVPSDFTLSGTAISVNQALILEVNDVEGSNTTNTTNTTIVTNTTEDTSNSTSTRRILSQTDGYPSSSPPPLLRRYLMVEEDICYCPVDAVAARAPFEAEMMDVFRSFVEDVQDSLRCVASVGECRFGTTFESSILVAFSESNVTFDFVSNIETSLQTTLNSLFAPRVGICQPDFRLVQSVTATVGIDIANDEGLRRQLYDVNVESRRTQDVSLRPSLQPSSAAPSVMTGNESSVFSPPLLTSFPTSSPSVSSQPTFAPTIETALGSVFILLRVNGVCNGCSNELFVQNQIIGGPARTLLEQDSQHDSTLASLRSLQALSSGIPDSRCFCPIESAVQETSPSVETVLDQYQTQLEESDVPLDVQDIQEVQVVDCEDEINDFDTQVVLQFTFQSEVSDREFRRLLDLIRATYNDLTGELYCDPLIRRIEDLDVDSIDTVAVGQDGCDLVAITFDVLGGCRGCEDDSELFDDNDDDDDRNRRLGDLNFGLYNNPWTNKKHDYNMGGSRQQRRRLEGSEICLCERQVLADRAPTLAEFEAVLGPEIDKANFDTICGLSSQFEEVLPTDAPSSSPSVVPSESPSACTASLENEFTTEVVLFVEDGNRLDTPSITQMGSSLETAYNEIVGNQFAVCDPLYRLVTSVSLLDEGTRRQRLLRKKENVRAQGGSLSSHSTTNRMMQEGRTGFPLRFTLTGQCEECDATSNILDTVSSELLLPRLQELVALFMDAGQLLAVEEIDKIACSNVVVQYDEVVIVELVPTCSEADNFGFDEILMLAIEETFVLTYNNLAVQYCDEYFTRLTAADVLNVGRLTDEGNIPIEIRVFAECLGCDPSEVGIYGNPSAIGRQAFGTGGDSGNRNRALLHRAVQAQTQKQQQYQQQVDNRLLQDDGEVCVCSAQAVANRAPSESEFIEAFRTSIEGLPLDCVASVGECQFGSTFTTDIVLSFEGNQTSLTDAVRQSIQESFRDLLNQLYEPSADVCNPEFRVIVDVAVVVDFTLNGEFIESGGGANATSPDDGSGRFLGDRTTEWHRQDQETDDESESPQSISPTQPTSTPVSPTEPRLPPTSSPTIDLDVGIVRTLLAVSGVCNGCANELFLSNQVLSGRQLLDPIRDPHDSAGFLLDRQLQDEVTTNSNCFCPLTAIVNLVPPSSEEVQGALSRRLEEEDVELVVQNIDTVSAISCDDEDETTNFVSDFTFVFSAFEGISDSEIEQLGFDIAKVYNNLVEEYCDPLIRREISLELTGRRRAIAGTAQQNTAARRGLEDSVEQQSSESICVNYEATFKVRGLCRGCENGTPLLDVTRNNRMRSLEMHNRIVSSGQRSQRTRRRHLENDEEECFCDSNTIAPRAPSLDELWLRLEVELGSLPRVCGQPVDCDPTAFVNEFSEITVLALLVDRGVDLTANHLLELEATYMTAYNELQNSLRVDKCGGRFRQLTSVTVDRGVMRKIRQLEEEEENEDRYDEDGIDYGRRGLAPGRTMSFVMNTRGGTTRQFTEGDDLDVLNGIPDRIVRSLGFALDVLAINEFLTEGPSAAPSYEPSGKPSGQPSGGPSSSPSRLPSTSPSTAPSSSPSTAPSSAPSSSPSTMPSTSPSISPSRNPSITPSTAPSTSPSASPSTSPSTSPSESPSGQPSVEPSGKPSGVPSMGPSASIHPSGSPSSLPSSSPSSIPSSAPSSVPSQQPSGSVVPSLSPSSVPSSVPSGMPSDSPSSKPSSSPSLAPSFVPSDSPSKSISPSLAPSANPSKSISPSLAPSESPSESISPSLAPSDSPSKSVSPSLMPSVTPSVSSIPSGSPTGIPSRSPSSVPSRAPSSVPSSVPSIVPSRAPSSVPSRAPSSDPSRAPSSAPSSVPSRAPSSVPSSGPSRTPSSVPSFRPSAIPTIPCALIICEHLIPELPAGETCGLDEGTCQCDGTICPSCVGTDACLNAGGTIGSNSCLDRNSCNALPTTSTVGSGACHGLDACGKIKAGVSIGNDSCTAGRNICLQAQFSIGNNQCTDFTFGNCPVVPNHGTGSCFSDGVFQCYGGRVPGNGIFIENNSCTGESSCVGLGEVDIRSGSCIGLNSCDSFSGDFIRTNACTGDHSCEGATGSVQRNSCTGLMSCQQFQGLRVGVGSCTGQNSCKSILNPSVIINTGSCKGASSCENYEGPEIGKNACNASGACQSCNVYVPDGQCNPGTACPC